MMTMRRETLKILEQTTLPRILVYLLEKGKASRTDLVHDIKGSQRAIYNSLPILKKTGLIEQHTAKGFPRRKDIWLTEKGKRVANLLIPIIEVLSKEP